MNRKKIEKASPLKGGKFPILSIALIVILILGAGIMFAKAKPIFGVMAKEVQEINMEVTASGYSPNMFTLKQGVPVQWNIDVKQLTGCNQELVLDNYGLNINLEEGMNRVEFTPDHAGIVKWSCGMNMLKGSFLITESGQATQQQISEATPKKSSSCSCGCGG